MSTHVNTPSGQVQSPLVVTEDKSPLNIHKISVFTQDLSWKKWSDFYDSVLKPLIQAGAEIKIELKVTGNSNEGISEKTIELVIKESLSQHGIDATVDCE